MIDKDGKIGGKINLIDLIIVIFILAVIAFVLLRFFIGDDTGIVNHEPVIIEFTCEETNDYTAEQIMIGDHVLDGGTGNSFGTIIDIKTGDAASYIVNNRNETVHMDKPGYKSVVITMEAEGTLEENGLIIERYRYGVGHSTTVFAGKCRLFGKISGIDPA